MDRLDLIKEKLTTLKNICGVEKRGCIDCKLKDDCFKIKGLPDELLNAIEESENLLKECKVEK